MHQVALRHYETCICAEEGNDSSELGEEELEEKETRVRSRTLVL